MPPLAIVACARNGTTEAGLCLVTVRSFQLLIAGGPEPVDRFGGPLAMPGELDQGSD